MLIGGLPPASRLLASSSARRARRAIVRAVADVRGGLTSRRFRTTIFPLSFIAFAAFRMFAHRGQGSHTDDLMMSNVLHSRFGGQA